jgi:hypothetical protein
MADAVSHWPLTAEARVRAPFRPMGFVVDKVAMRQVFLRVSRFSPSILFHNGSPFSYVIWHMNNRPVRSRSSETSSHPIDMNCALIRIVCFGYRTFESASPSMKELCNYCIVIVGSTAVKERL